MPIRVLPILAIALVAVVGFFVPAPASVVQSDVIKIVSSLPRTGSARGQTDTIVDGIRLALKEAEYKLDIGGKPYRLVYLDLDDANAAAGQWTAENEISNANLATRDPDVMVYIGTYNSGAARISMPILNKANILMVSPANTAPELTKPDTGARCEPMCYRPNGEVNYVRVVPTDDLQGALGAEWAQDMGAKSVFILDDNETYGQGVANLFESHARKIGLTILGHETIDWKAPEFSALMTKIRQKNPDLIYFGGTTQTKAGQLLKDMVKAGMDKCKFMGPDGCHEEAMIESAGYDMVKDRFYATFGGLTSDRLAVGAGKVFVEKYKAEYGKEPTEAYAVYGYESGRVALAAIRNAGVKDRAAIMRAGRTIKDFDGASGSRWSFDANGDTTLQQMTGSAVKLVNENGKDVPRLRGIKDLQPRK
jgi:branched-chain amino acid transport system substrate-binding protein